MSTIERPLSTANTVTTLDRLAGTHNESVVTVAFVERLQHRVMFQEAPTAVLGC